MCEGAKEKVNAILQVKTEFGFFKFWLFFISFFSIIILSKIILEANEIAQKEVEIIKFSEERLVLRELTVLTDGR